MSYQNKGLWMAKGGGHLTDGDAAYDNPSRIEPKRSHQWFADAAEPELFPNKKQATRVPNSKSTTGILNATPWENASNFQSVPSQLMDQLFGGEPIGSFNFNEQHISPVGTDELNMRKRVINEQFGEDSSMGLSISHTLEDPETCLSYSGLRKVKVNQVKDSDDVLHAPKEHNSGTSIGQAYNHVNETSFISMGHQGPQDYSNEDGSVILMGQTYNKGDANVRSTGSPSEKENDNSLSIGHSYNKGESNTIPIGVFHEVPIFDPLARPLSSYELIYGQSSIQESEMPEKKGLDASSAVLNVSQVVKSRPESVSKNKSELKATRKEAPNSFPSNVRSLISTGILDGVPVKYVSLSREELCGSIKGSGYLCACESCNYSKVLNAYEFERHAGCKTKHPNNHIYFESGKTIYQIVQELRNTPESQLFDAIQTITGSPINQKSFRIWKESFQAATRELQRIYGKENH
ncbi:hypothetical protein U1Q18_033283 [Sarracenia purpurea var. burkii]